MRIAARENILFSIWLLIAVCTYAIVSGMQAGNALYYFNLPLLFFMIFVMPGPVAAGRPFSPVQLLYLSLTFAVGLFPFYAGLCMEFPYRFFPVFFLAVWVIIEGFFWCFLYIRNKILYNAAVFLIVLLPLLIGVLTLRVSGMDYVFNLSPFMFIKSLLAGQGAVSWTAVTALHAVFFILAILIKSESDTE